MVTVNKLHKDLRFFWWQLVNIMFVVKQYITLKE